MPNAAKKYIPEGTHTLTPYLVVRDAPRAIEFYKKAFGATETMRAFGPDGKSIMHAQLKIGDSPLYLSEEMLDWGSKSPLAIGGTGLSIMMYVEDADTVYNKAVAAGATSKMPMSDQFWGDRWGSFIDPFGHAWQIATHKWDLTPDEMKKAGDKAMAEMMAKKPA